MAALLSPPPKSLPCTQNDPKNHQRRRHVRARAASTPCGQRSAVSSVPELSNFLADLAERTGDKFRRGRARTVEAATDYIETGRMLVEARDACRGTRGAWGAFLARADIADTTARLLIRIARADMDPKTLAELGLRGAAAAIARPTKTATVAGLAPDIPAPQTSPRPAAPTLPSLYRRRRKAGQCVDCGEPADGKARCPACRANVAARARHRRQLARTGEVLAPRLAPRLAEAAEAGDGLTLTLQLSPAEVAALAPK